MLGMYMNVLVQEVNAMIATWLIGVSVTVRVRVSVIGLAFNCVSVRDILCAIGDPVVAGMQFDQLPDK